MGENKELLEAILKNMDKWRSEDKAHLDKVKLELSVEIAYGMLSSATLIQTIKKDFAAENAALRSEIADLKSRLELLEQSIASSAPDSQSPPKIISQFVTYPSAIENQAIRYSISAVEKHLRRNNVIIRGLAFDKVNPTNSLSEFLETHFNAVNCISSVSVFGKENNKLKVTLKDQNVKNIVMEKKRNLKILIYMNHDLTPEEERMEKSIRDLGKKLRQEGKKIRYGHLRV